MFDAVFEFMDSFKTDKAVLKYAKKNNIKGVKGKPSKCLVSNILSHKFPDLKIEVYYGYLDFNGGSSPKGLNELFKSIELRFENSELKEFEENQFYGCSRL